MMRHVLLIFALVALASANVNKYIQGDIQRGLQKLRKLERSAESYLGINPLIAAFRIGLYTDWSTVIPDIEAAYFNFSSSVESSDNSQSTVPSHYHPRYHTTSHIINTIISAALEDREDLCNICLYAVNLMDRIDQKQLSNESLRMLKPVYNHIKSVAIMILLSQSS